MPNLVELESAMPVAPLKLLALDSCKELGDRVNEYLVIFAKMYIMISNRIPHSAVILKKII